MGKMSRRCSLFHVVILKSGEAVAIPSKEEYRRMVGKIKPQLLVRNASILTWNMFGYHEAWAYARGFNVGRAYDKHKNLVGERLGLAE